MALLVLYGIPTCDSCRKAVAWLNAGGHAYRFHDLRVDGPPDASQIRSWSQTLGWKTLLNRRSTTFRALTPDQQSITEGDDAVALIERYPLLIKRPLIESEFGIVAGFDPDRLTGILTHA
jgi:Spx/MgsR family transcriptional regulator